MKKYLKVMCLILGILISTPQIQYASTAKHKTPPGTAIFVMATQNPEPIIKEVLFNIKQDTFQLDMHIPQFEGLENLTFQKQLNDTLLKEARFRKNQILELAHDYSEDMLQDGLSSIPFEYIETFTVIPSLYPNYTVEIYRYQYSGGAHGIGELSYINLRLDQNEQVTLKSLFKNSIDYISILNPLVQEEINRRTAQGEFFFSGSDGFTSIKEDQPFFINSSGDLILVFNVYEIAPYASGSVYITISAEKLTSYLK